MFNDTIRGFAILFVLLSLMSITAYASSPFEVVSNSSHIEVMSGETFHASVVVHVPRNNHLYADSFNLDFIALDGIRVKDITYPNPVQYDDPVIGRSISVYDGDVDVDITMYVPKSLDIGRHDMLAKLSFKGCSPKMCYRPEHREVPFAVIVIPASSNTVMPTNRAKGMVKEGGNSFFKSLKNIVGGMNFVNAMRRQIPLALLVAFIAGLLTSLTPCVWPLIPAMLLFIGVHPERSVKRNVCLTASLIMGLVFAYSILGILAVALGRNVGFLFQYRWFIVLVVLFFIAMSLSMFGLFDLYAPRRWQAFMHKFGGDGPLGAFFSGMGLGLVASPCVGPVLASILGYVAAQRNYAYGFLFIFVYATGFGLLFVVLAAFYEKLVGRLKSGYWMTWIRRALGVMLLIPAVFYGATLFHSYGEYSRSEGPSVVWITSKHDAFNFAKRENRAMMLDFSASWCTSCLRLQRKFFSRSDIARLSYRLIPLEIDATVEKDDVRHMMNKYGITGLPAVVFLSPDGSFYRDLTVMSYDPARIKANMIEAIKRAARHKKSATENKARGIKFKPRKVKDN